MPRKEELNEEYLKRRVRETGGFTRKVKWIATRGAPDRLCAWPERGRYAFVEVKEEGQPWGLQEHQRREHQRMRMSGMTVVVLNSKHEIDQFIVFMMHVC
jgi:hypothetical protein